MTLLAIVALLVIFVAQNADCVDVYFLYAEAEMPLSVLMFLSFCAGVGATLVVGYGYKLYSIKQQKKEEERELYVAKVEQENEALRREIDHGHGQNHEGEPNYEEVHE